VWLSGRRDEDVSTDQIVLTSSDPVRLAAAFEIANLDCARVGVSSQSRLSRTIFIAAKDWDLRQSDLSEIRHPTFILDLLPHELFSVIIVCN
jgi:hypothetical protein